MRAIRNDTGTWSFESDGSETPLSEPYRGMLSHCLACLWPTFEKAADQSEFEFLMTLLRVRGLEDAGWDPYLTTYSAIDSMTDLHHQLKNAEQSRHLELWLYAHLVEASEPYELIANLLGVANGERWSAWRFPLVGKEPNLR